MIVIDRRDRLSGNVPPTLFGDVEEVDHYSTDTDIFLVLILDTGYQVEMPKADFMKIKEYIENSEMLEE